MAQPAAAVAAGSELRNSRLVALPRELLDNIASYLPTNDFNSLRVTCRQLESKLFPYWSNSFFKKKQFSELDQHRAPASKRPCPNPIPVPVPRYLHYDMDPQLTDPWQVISEFSLQALLDISQHQTLSRCLKHLIIGLDEFEVIRPDDLTTLEAFQQWRSAVCSQERLLDTGAAIDLLSKALPNLTNLETVDIRDFNSATRYRDPNSPGGTVAEWRSYGSSEYRNWLSHRSRKYNSLLRSGTHIHNDFAVRVFKAALVAAGQSGRNVKGLEILLRNRYGALGDTAFALFPPVTDGIRSVLGGLTRLHLDLRLDRVLVPQALWQLPDSEHLTSAEAFYDPSTTNLRRFLGFVPNVTWLRLNFVHDHLHSAPSVASRFLEWLALLPGQFAVDQDQAGWSDANPPPVVMPLRQLDLGDMQLKLNVLASVIKKFSQLNQLSLKGVSLPADQVQSHSTSSERRDNSPWARFVRKLLSLAPNLRRLSLRQIQETAKSPSHAPEAVFFLAPGQVPAMSPKTMHEDIYEVDKASLDRLLDSMWTYRSWAEAHKSADAEDESEEDDVDDSEDELAAESPADEETDELDEDIEIDEDGVALYDDENAIPMGYWGLGSSGYS